MIPNPGSTIWGLHGCNRKISEAYQVLSNEDLRKQYDKYGKERAVPDSGFGTNRYSNDSMAQAMLTKF